MISIVSTLSDSAEKLLEHRRRVPGYPDNTTSEWWGNDGYEGTLRRGYNYKRREKPEHRKE